MGKYFCDYCDTYLTHDSPSVRKTHCAGRKHKDNVHIYYQGVVDDAMQKMVDKTVSQFQNSRPAGHLAQLGSISSLRSIYCFCVFHFIRINLFILNSTELAILYFVKNFFLLYYDIISTCNVL